MVIENHGFILYSTGRCISQTKGIKFMEKILEAKDLCKTFSNESLQQHVLKNLNITMNKGDFTVIMGNSGSGKSTLLYSLSGMDRPTLGKVFIANEEISKYSNDKLAIFRRRNCGFVFQQNFLNDTMSVLDNILVSGLLVSKDRKKIVKRAKELLLKTGLTEEIFYKYPTQLSGGEAQRAALVRGIINEPSILFADEPTGALNSNNTVNVLDILSDFNRKGQTIIMVTHDVRAARRGNRVLYLKDGIILDEIKLGSYEPNDSMRHDKLRLFLNEMGW